MASESTSAADPFIGRPDDATGGAGPDLQPPDGTGSTSGGPSWRPRLNRDDNGNPDDGSSVFGPSDDDNSEYEDIDPNEFDLMLSRSVQSAGGAGLLGLEPESVEYSMLRNTRRRRSSVTNGNESIGRGGGGGYRRRRESDMTSSVSHSRTRSHQHHHYHHRSCLGARAEQDEMSAKVPSFGVLPDEETPLLPSTSHESTHGSVPRSKPLPPKGDGPLLSSSSSSSSTTEDPKSSIATPYLSGVSPARFWTLFAGIMVTYFVACFDSTIMASSHPVITSYFGSSNSASWLSTAFLLTSTSFQPLLGGLSDAIGRKQPYIATMSIFLLATLWCALAQSMTSFILARAACGLGAGGMMTLGSIMISDLVPIEIRGAYQSYINIVYGVGAMLGAGLGGAMADYLGWRWEFGVQVPLLMASLVVAVTTVPPGLGLYGRPKQGFGEAMKTFDFMGSFLMSTSITILILGLTLGGNVLPWSHPFVIGSLVTFAVFFPLFLYVETIAVKPIMPIHLVCLSPHWNLIFSNAIGAFVNNAILFNVPLFFQGVLLTSATTSGLRLIICSGVASAAGTATGFLITSTRRLKWPLVTGTTLIFLGTLSIASMQRSWPTFLYLLCLVPSSAGIGFQMPGTFMAILAVADQKKQAVVTSTLILWRSLGMVLGVACSSLVVQNALWYYLERFVQGDEKESVIEKVRGSVEAIRGLEVVYREQVVQSYEAALRVTFLCCSVLAFTSLLIILPVRLPRLGERK